MSVRSTSLAIVALCAPALMAQAPQAASADAAFETLAKGIIDGYLRLNPESATQLGDHRFDDRLSDMSLKGLEEQRAWAKSQRVALMTISEARLSAENRVDRAILLDQMDATLFQLDELKSWQGNPLAYNPGDALYGLLSREFAPLPERLKSVKARLLLIPGLLDAAKANLKHPPRIYTETAIQQLLGALGMVKEDVAAAAAQAGLKDELAPAQDRAAKALESYIVWLKSDLLPRSTGDFRIGKAAFRKQQIGRAHV